MIIDAVHRHNNNINEIYGENGVFRVQDISVECSNLSSNLRDEIQSYQPIVDKIVRAVVNGKYRGDTWNA